MEDVNPLRKKEIAMGTSRDISEEGGAATDYVKQDGPSHRLIQMTEQEARWIRTYITGITELDENDEELPDSEDKLKALAIIDAALTA